MAVLYKDSSYTLMVDISLNGCIISIKWRDIA